MADKALAQQILQHGLRRRTKLTAVHRETGAIATPVFPEYKQETVEHLLDVGIAAETIVSRMTAPEAWICESQRGKTAEEAIRKALDHRQFVAASAATSRAVSKDLGLPALTGSQKQVTWAMNIRTKHAEKQPDSKHLKAQKAASWWIENRNLL